MTNKFKRGNIIAHLSRVVLQPEDKGVVSWLQVPASPRWYGKEWDLVLHLAIEFPEWEVEFMTDTAQEVVWDEYNDV